MNILISGDWHFSDAPIDAYRFATIERVVPVFIKKYKVDLVVFLGDICEAKDQHKAGLVNRVVKIFHQISELAPLVFLQGNHDWLSNPANPFFGFLGRLERISWVGRPTPLGTLQNLSRAFPGASRTLLLPHSADYERDWGEIDFSEYDWAFAHQAFTGAVSESGFRLGGGVPLSYFPPNLRLVSGDVHQPQQLGNLTYVGAPFSIDFGDLFEPRMLLLKDGKLTSLPCPGPGKRLIEVTSLAKLGAIETLPGDALKVRVTLPAEEAPKWAEMAASIREWGLARKAVSVQAVPVLIGGRKSMTKAKGAPKKPDAELLKDYAAARAVGEDTLKTGLKFI